MRSHEDGWGTCFDNLERVLGEGSSGSGPTWVNAQGARLRPSDPDQGGCVDSARVSMCELRP